MKIPSFLDPSASAEAKFHFVMVAVWCVLIIPTLTIWRDSIVWIGFMSIYAIIVSHRAGYSAARAEQAAEN